MRTRKAGVTGGEIIRGDWNFLEKQNKKYPYSNDFMNSHFWHSEECFFCKEKHPQLGWYNNNGGMVAICYDCLLKECNKETNTSFKPIPEAQKNLTKFLKGLGASSKYGYLLVDMLDDNIED